MSCQLGINLNLSRTPGKTLTWTEAVLRYLCEQSGKHYNNGVYFARQTFFKTGRILTGKFDLDFEPSVSKTAVAQSLPSTPAQQTLRSKPRLVDGQLKFLLGLTVRRWFGLSEFFLPMPSNIDIAKVKGFTILPKDGAFYLKLSYEVSPRINALDISQALSIDLGTADNLAACVDTLGNSLLIDARTMKAMNQLWNKKVATRKEGKPEAYWDGWLDRVA